MATPRVTHLRRSDAVVISSPPKIRSDMYELQTFARNEVLIEVLI